jgi:hypothetical protein
MGLRRIQQIQQCRCWASSLVVALFLETCGPLDLRICFQRISIFGFFFEGEHVQKQPARIRRIGTKYWGVHFQRHCRNSSPGSIRHEKSEWKHRWTLWRFPTLNITLVFVFYYIVIRFWQIEHVSEMGCVTFRSSCLWHHIANKLCPLNCWYDPVMYEETCT